MKTAAVSPYLAVPHSIPDGAAEALLIVGDPLAQALSPVLFNEAFRASGRNALLLPAEVGPDGLHDFLRGVRGMRNLRGIVVTYPHKVAAIKELDRIEENARRIGSVNAIRCDRNGTWTGANYDGDGCVALLAQSGVEVEGACALIVGIGGAGAAVAHAFAARGVSHLHLHD